MFGEEIGRIRVLAQRGGTIGEISQFLADLENAYLALYLATTWSADVRRLRRSFPLELLYDLGYPLGLVGGPTRGVLTPPDIPPRERLVLKRVRIESPGFWEFLASLNPLQQIREYLNDRHERRKDRDFREAAEQERLQLENELIRQQILEEENSVLRERILMLREIGYSDDEINRLLWRSIGSPLAQLGRHQDTGLIGGAKDSGG